MSRKIWIPAAVVAVVALVAGVVWFFATRTPGSDAAARVQQLQVSTAATTTATSTAPSTTQVPSQSQATPSASASADASSPMVPHLQPGQELSPTPIQGFNFLIDSKTWNIDGPFDGSTNRMTKVNLTEIGGKPACKPEVAMVDSRLCPGFIVVDADQSPFYTDKACLTIGSPNDPTYKFSRRLNDVRINGMVVERAQMARCDAPGASFVWKFPRKDGTAVHVIEVGNDSAQKPSNPLPGLVELLDKVTAVG